MLEKFLENVKKQNDVYVKYQMWQFNIKQFCLTQVLSSSTIKYLITVEW